MMEAINRPDAIRQQEESQLKLYLLMTVKGFQHKLSCRNAMYALIACNLKAGIIAGSFA